MMSWQLMARKMMIRGHFLRVVCCVKLCCGVLHYDVLCGRMKIRGHLLVVLCRVELCCGVLDYVVLCGRMKIRGHHYTCAAGLSAKRG